MVAPTKNIAVVFYRIYRRISISRSANIFDFSRVILTYAFITAIPVQRGWRGNKYSLCEP